MYINHSIFALSFGSMFCKMVIEIRIKQKGKSKTLELILRSQYFINQKNKNDVSNLQSSGKKEPCKANRPSQISRTSREFRVNQLATVGKADNRKINC